MVSSRLVRKMFDKVVYRVPVVVLERITIPKWMGKKCQKNDEFGNEEPKRKKFKTEKKDIDVLKMKFKRSDKDILKSPQNKDLTLSSVEINKGLESRPNITVLNRKKTATKRASEKKIQRSALTNSLPTGKIKIRDVRTINENFDLINNEIMLFDKKKSVVSRVYDDTRLLFLHSETSQLALQYFEQLHAKYFDKHVQDTIVIINNVVFMNLLTNLHCISRINWILRWKDKHKMIKNIQSQSILHIKYVKLLDSVLKRNCIDIISNFEDSDYEHAFLMLMLSLFASLKMFGSNVFRNSRTILKKLERLQWKSVKHQHFDHNRVQTTFTSDVFCASYHNLSKLIGEGSYTDPNVVKWWELFCSPAIFKTTYFRSAIKAITNSADVRKVVRLIDKASNNIRLYSHLKNGESPSAYKKDKFEKLIALVNDSARVNTNINETSQPCTGEFDALDQINQSTMSIIDERIFTSSITQSKTRTSKPSNLNALCENRPDTHTNIPSTPAFVKVYPVGNTSIPQLNTVPPMHTYLHKKFNSTIQIGKEEHRINRILFHRMISKSKEGSMKLTSSTSQSNNTDVLKPEGYVISDHIASGSFGEVRHAIYKNEDEEIRLAVKIIDTGRIRRGYFSKFLPRELDIMCKIKHPYIIHTHSILQKKSVFYVFMKFAGKGDLFKYINDNGAIPENQARIWFRHLGLAIQYLHTMDIIHRDIKCENILITDNFTVKLTDFSFSKFIERSKKLNCHTHAYTMNYASPEILRTQPYDGKPSDIWSFGVVLYYMLNKRIPFDTTNATIMYKQQVTRKWNHRPSVENLMNENLIDCLNNILEPKPTKRWTIDTVLVCDWIKMDRELIEMTNQESLALSEALDEKNQSLIKKHVLKLDMHKSDTRHILDQQSPTYLSVERRPGSTDRQSIADSDGSLSGLERLASDNNVPHSSRASAPNAAAHVASTT